MIPEALALTDCPMDETRDIRDYNMLLDRIGEFGHAHNSLQSCDVPADALQSEAGRLQALMMSVSPAEKNRAVSGLLSLLPVLRVRDADLATARQLLQTGKANLCLTLTMQSLKLAS